MEAQRTLYESPLLCRMDAHTQTNADATHIYVLVVCQLDSQPDQVTVMTNQADDWAIDLGDVE